MANWVTKPRSAAAQYPMPTVVSAAPTIVTNMTGFFNINRGLSLRNESPMAGPAMVQSKSEGDFCVIKGDA